MSKANEVINFYEMASLQPSDTNTSLTIWIDEVGKDRKGKHNLPRLKVVYNGKYLPVLIDAKPKVLEGDIPSKYFNKISEWIILNLDLLLKHWNQELTTMELFQAIKKL